MENSVQARKATTNDIQTLVALMKDFYAEANFSLDEQWAADAFRSLLENGDRGCVWIACIGTEAAGHAVLTVRFTMEHGGMSGYVDDLFVEEKHRRKGAAHLLLTELEEECHARKCKAIIVEVAENNPPAQGAYAKSGLNLVDDGRVLFRKVLSFDKQTGEGDR